jgi:hypothetical protein
MLTQAAQQEAAQATEVPVAIIQLAPAVMQHRVLDVRIPPEVLPRMQMAAEIIISEIWKTQKATTKILNTDLSKDVPGYSGPSFFFAKNNIFPTTYFL